MGANDAANCVGTSVGSRILSMRRAMFLLAFFVILGAALEGHRVMTTVGRGIVLFENAALQIGDTPFTFVPWAAFASILAAAIWVTAATYFALPVSCSHSIVGGVMGAGFALMLLDSPALATAGVAVDFTKSFQIVLSWLLTPLAAMAFAYLTFHIARRCLRRVKSVTLLNTIYSVMVVAVGSYMTYSFGANDVGSVAGAVLAANPGFDTRMLALFAGVAITSGAITYGHKVINTIGKRITALAPATAFAAQLGAALTVHIFIQFGIPVSTSHAVVGGVIGTGLVKGTSAVSRRGIKWIPLIWVLTPLVVVGISFVLTMLLMGM